MSQLELSQMLIRKKTNAKTNDMYMEIVESLLTIDMSTLVQYTDFGILSEIVTKKSKKTVLCRSFFPPKHVLK